MLLYLAETLDSALDAGKDLVSTLEGDKRDFWILIRCSGPNWLRATAIFGVDVERRVATSIP